MSRGELCRCFFAVFCGSFRSYAPGLRLYCDAACFGV
jgi:hypothetical protein